MLRKLYSIKRRRAVAPIIATLLMVAIAVVGGILIFVFAQGFFQDTQIVAPTIEQIEIWGYNATDAGSNKLGTHSGVEVAVKAAQNNRLINGEAFFVFVRNSGGGEVLISDVQVYGVDFTAVTVTTFGTENPGTREWLLSTDGTAGCGCQILGPGQEGTIAIGWDESVNGKVKVGRPMLVKIETGSGTTFTKQVIMGRDLG